VLVVLVTAMANFGVIVAATLGLSVAAQKNYVMKWKSFKEEYGKVYNGDEEDKRFAIFKSNVDFIDETNAQNLSYTLDVNQFADLTSEEFAAGYMGFKTPEEKWGDLPYLGKHEYSGKNLSSAVDWTTKGAVTPVKNQGQCGSCWSFSTTGSLEGAWKIATGNLVSMSEQQFVDCDHVDQGCGGGLMDNAFKFAKENAICQEASYKYKGKRGTCMASSCTVGIPKGGVTGFKDVQKTEQALMEAVAQQPVSIAIEADKPTFQLYKGGVLKAPCGAKLDHGVLAVGYGTDNGMDYWKVKNSWGATWGEQGYIRLLRGKGATGECGILSQPSYPVVSGKPGPTPPSPSPPTPPAPSPPVPPAPGSTHYEKPPCKSDEIDAEVQGADGEVCAPKCDGTSCPTDVPAGTKAQPQCILQTQSGDKYCALACTLPFSCPSGAHCARIAGISGICVYPKGDTQPEKTLQVIDNSEITV